MNYYLLIYCSIFLEQPGSLKMFFKLLFSTVVVPSSFHVLTCIRVSIFQSGDWQDLLYCLYLISLTIRIPYNPPTPIFEDNGGRSRCFRAQHGVFFVTAHFVTYNFHHFSSISLQNIDERKVCWAKGMKWSWWDDNTTVSLNFISYPFVVYMQCILITGASSGIGETLALDYAKSVSPFMSMMFFFLAPPLMFGIGNNVLSSRDCCWRWLDETRTGFKMLPKPVRNAERE